MVAHIEDGTDGDSVGLIYTVMNDCEERDSNWFATQSNGNEQVMTKKRYGISLMLACGLLATTHLSATSELSEPPTTSSSPTTPTPPDQLAPSELTHEFTLDNGMKIVVREDHRSPIVLSQVWYRVGSTYEPPGMTGVSHILEHMLFKGTKRLQPGDFSKLVSEYGGQENAFTSFDYTGFYQMWDKSRLPISFELEADRMFNATFPLEEYEKEMNVIREERRLRTEDNPNAKANERFMATAYSSSPYRTPIIGWMSDLKSITRDQVISWYKTWYAPNNATLVVVGDVQPEEVLELAKTYFGPLPKKEIPPTPPALEVEPLGERTLTVKLPAKLPNLTMGFNTPTLATVPEEQEWEVYSLRMLAGVLDGGSSARLASRLERGSQIAAGVGADYSIFSRGDGLFTFSGVPNKPYKLDDLEKAIFKEIKTLQEELVSDEELERIKAQVISSLVYQQDSISSQASLIGSLESIGSSWRVIDTYVDKLDAVTPEQIREVAKKYLVKDRLTLAHLEPQPI